MDLLNYHCPIPHTAVHVSKYCIIEVSLHVHMH